MARHVHDDGNIATLSGQAGTGAAGQDRDAMFVARTDDFKNVFRVLRQYNADRDLPVVRRISRVERASTGTKVHFTSDARS